MRLLNYIESIDSVVDNAEIESLYMLLEYYNKELTMSVYMESEEIKKPEVQQANPQQQPQQQQPQQNPSVFEKIWNGIKRLFEIVKNAFKKFFELFKKKPFKVSNYVKAIMDASPEQKQKDATALKNLQKTIDTFKKSNPNATINGAEVINDVVNIYTYTPNHEWYLYKFALNSQESLGVFRINNNIQESAIVGKAFSPVMNGIEAGTRIGSLTGNSKVGAAAGTGIGALKAAGAGTKAMASAIGFPIGMLAGFAIGAAFSICAQVLETTIVKSIKTLPQPNIVKKAGDDLYTQSESFYSIMSNMKLDTDVNVLAKPVYEYIKHDKFDHTGENCISIMNNWLARVNKDPVLSGRSQNNQGDLNKEQLQLLTDATVYIEILNEQNGDTEIIQLLGKLNESFDKTNQYVQSPNCIVNKIPVDKIKQLMSNILSKNAKSCLTFINCMNSIKNIGVSMWDNINGANQYVNGNGVNQSA